MKISHRSIKKIIRKALKRRGVLVECRKIQEVVRKLWKKKKEKCVEESREDGWGIPL